MSNKRTRKPAISICRSDYERLSDLADTMNARNPAVSGELLAELDRARIVEDAKLRAGIARMGSSLVYCTDDGVRRTVTLVFPGEADISRGRVSILTPIGTALIGLAAGQSIDWRSHNGVRHRLTVERVDQTSSVGELDAATPLVD